ncbi:MAG: MBL fold metallo-hydrolase, partial [Parvularculaceae bacterium]
MNFIGKILGVIALCFICFALLFGVLTRVPAVQDAMFDKALENNFSPRAAPLLKDDGLNVYFCGTGSPLPSKKRAQTCTAIFAGGKYFLVDTGTGSWENIQAAGIPGEKLAGIFLTHFHSDHIGDLGEADLGSWVAGRPGKLIVYGPEGVARVVAGANEEYALDHEYRTAHHGPAIADPATEGLEPHTFEGGATVVVLDEDGLKVTAFPVKHDPVKPAVGYRFDYQGRSVVVSGDTAPTEKIVTASKGADLLIHEAQANHMVAKMRAAAAKAGNTRIAKIFGDIPSYHTSPEDAAREANEA